MMNNLNPASMGGAFPTESPVNSVKLSVEALPESRIQEISLDGTETYFRPLTMSENLCKMATKIDFLAEEEGRIDEEETDEDQGTKKSFQNQRWPWEGIRNRLQQALTEVSVLSDVLTVTHNKGPSKKEGVPGEGGKYMTFAQARKELLPIKQPAQLPAKKKGLNAAAEILFSGEKRMRSAGDEISPDMGYHLQLLKLRKFWRIRRVGAKVLGDLSYRSIGSDFWHNGNFEVIKTTDDDFDDDSVAHTTIRNQQGILTKHKPALKVIVGADLKGYASVKISVKKKQGGISTNLDQDAKSFMIDGMVNDSDPVWHKVLCYAQNVLFCRELFEKLAKQAVQLKTTATMTPFLVVKNKITSKIFPDTELCIELLTDSGEADNVDDPPKLKSQRVSDDIFSLKLAAMKLLIDHHTKVFNIPAPHPATATFGLTNIQRKAPTNPFTISQMQAVTVKKSKSLLECLVDMAKHWELKQRLCKAIDNMGRLVRDPYLQAQWSTVGSTTETSVRLVVLSAGYETSNKTAVDISVGTDVIKAIQRDGKIINLSSDLKQIEDYLLSLLCLHQLCTVHELCVILGWTMQHFSQHGVGTRSTQANVGTLMAVSPQGNSSISLRCWVSRNISAMNSCIQYEVHAQTAHDDLAKGISHRSNAQTDINSEMNAVQHTKWSLLGNEWKEVDWVKLHGRHFIGKFESLLTFLRSDI